MAFSLETIMDGQLFVTLKNSRMVLGWNTGTVILHTNDQVTTFSVQNNLQRSSAKMQCILDQITDDQTEFDRILKNSHPGDLRSYFYSDSSLRKHYLLSLACGGFAQTRGELGIAAFDRFDQCFEHSLADIKRGQRKLRRFGPSDFQQLCVQRAKEIVRTGRRWRKFFSHNCSVVSS